VTHGTCHAPHPWISFRLKEPLVKAERGFPKIKKCGDVMERPQPQWEALDSAAGMHRSIDGL
jgi:hypothetical protein